MGRKEAYLLIKVSHLHIIIVLLMINLNYIY
jgi:hypothetical protein